MSGRSPRWFTGIKPNGVKITIKIGSTYFASYAYVKINGIKYTAAAEVLVPVGAEVIVTVSQSSTSGPDATITLNGAAVTLSSRGGSYTYVAEKPATIMLSAVGDSWHMYGGRAAIVTE